MPCLVIQWVITEYIGFIQNKLHFLCSSVHGDEGLWYPAQRSGLFMCFELKQSL